MKNSFIPTLGVSLISVLLFVLFYTHADKPDTSQTSPVLKNSVPDQVNPPSCQSFETSASQQASSRQRGVLENDAEKLAGLRFSAKTFTDPVAKGLATVLKNRSEAEQRLFLEQLFQVISQKIEGSWSNLERPMVSKETFTEAMREAFLDSLAEQGYTPPENTVLAPQTDISEDTKKVEEKNCSCCAKGMKALRQRLQKAREAREARELQQAESETVSDVPDQEKTTPVPAPEKVKASP